MFEENMKQKQEIFRKAENMDLGADVFEICIQTVKITLKWSRMKPEYSQIAMMMEIDNSEFISKLRTASMKGLRDLIEHDKNRGLIKPEIDSNLAVDMIYILIWKQFSLNEFDENLYLKRLKEGFQITKDGLSMG